MNTQVEILASLKDISGVMGSFLVTEAGRCTARDMPAMFTDDLLHELSPRIGRLLDVFSTNGAETHACTVRFRDYLFIVRAVKKNALCVLFLPDVNLPALKMGLNLATRRLSVTAVPAPAPASPRETSRHVQSRHRNDFGHRKLLCSRATDAPTGDKTLATPVQAQRLQKRKRVGNLP